MVMDLRENIRTNKETRAKIKELMDKFPGEYTDKSQTYRSAIHYLYNMKLRGIRK